MSSSHSISSKSVALTIYRPAPLKRSGHSAFRAFVSSPLQQQSRALSASANANAGASPQTKNALQPGVGSLLNELQKLQMDTEAASAGGGAGGATSTGTAQPSAASAATSSSALPPLSLDPAPSSSVPTPVAAPSLSAPMDESSTAAHVCDRSDKPLHRCTLDLLQLFRACNPAYSWTGQLQPRRVLTSPSAPSAHNPNDNVNNNLIMSVGDLLWHNTEDSHVHRDKLPPPPKPRSEGAPPQRWEKTFRVLELLGEGTFGQVVKCEEVMTLSPAHPAISVSTPHVPSSAGSKPKLYRAIKVIKNKPAYYNQALMEIQILRVLNEKFDPHNKHHLLRMIESFNCKGHLCLVFELLSVNLYELMKQNGYRGLSWSLLRMFLKQLLDSLSVLTQAKIIHCDLKPENILLNKLTSPDITLIDFGSACFEYQTVYSYIQSRFYRSPEVLIGLPYNSTIDLWSFGCLAPDTLVWLADGSSIRADQLQPHHQLLGDDGRPVSIVPNTLIGTKGFPMPADPGMMQTPGAPAGVMTRSPGWLPLRTIRALEPGFDELTVSSNHLLTVAASSWARIVVDADGTQRAQAFHFPRDCIGADGLPIPGYSADNIRRGGMLNIQPAYWRGDAASRMKYGDEQTALKQQVHDWNAARGGMRLGEITVEQIEQLPASIRGEQTPNGWATHLYLPKLALPLTFPGTAPYLSPALQHAMQDAGCTTGAIADMDYSSDPLSHLKFRAAQLELALRESAHLVAEVSEAARAALSESAGAQLLVASEAAGSDVGAQARARIDVLVEHLIEMSAWSVGVWLALESNDDGAFSAGLCSHPAIFHRCQLLLELLGLPSVALDGFLHHLLVRLQLVAAGEPMSGNKPRFSDPTLPCRAGWQHESPRMRLALLAGLIDVCGSIDKAERYTLTLRESPMADFVCVLIRQLGWTVPRPVLSESGSFVLSPISAHFDVQRGLNLACDTKRTLSSGLRSQAPHLSGFFISTPAEGSFPVVSFQVCGGNGSRRFLLSDGAKTHNCISAELYLGLPLFPGITQHNQLQRIIKFIGPPPSSMLDRGKNTKKFFKTDSSSSSVRYTLKTAEEYATDTRTEVAVHKTYFKGNSLKEVIDLYPMRKGLNEAQKAQELEDRKSFLHFLQGFLRWDASTRWTPKQAMHHPFLQRQPLATLDEAAFERLRYVLDQPASVPPLMPALSRQNSSTSSATSSSSAAASTSTPTSASTSAGTVPSATTAHLPSTPLMTPMLSPSNKASQAAAGIGAGVVTAATAVSGQLLTAQELVARQMHQQQMQQGFGVASGSYTQTSPALQQRSSSFSGGLLPQLPSAQSQSQSQGGFSQQAQLSPHHGAMMAQQPQSFAQGQPYPPVMQQAPYTPPQHLRQQIPPQQPGQQAQQQRSPQHAVQPLLPQLAPQQQYGYQSQQLSPQAHMQRQQQQQQQAPSQQQVSSYSSQSSPSSYGYAPSSNVAGWYGAAAPSQSQGQPPAQQMGFQQGRGAYGAYQQ